MKNGIISHIIIIMIDEFLSRSAFIFRNPKSLASLEGFFKPLSVSVWVLTVVSALLLMMILRQSCVYEGRIVHRHADVTWSYFGINIVGALCQQGELKTIKYLDDRSDCFPPCRRYDGCTKICIGQNYNVVPLPLHATHIPVLLRESRLQPLDGTANDNRIPRGSYVFNHKSWQ